MRLSNANSVSEFLQAHDIGTALVEPGQQAGQARLHRVDVPGGDSHSLRLAAVVRRRFSRRPLGRFARAGRMRASQHQGQDQSRHREEPAELDEIAERQGGQLSTRNLRPP